MLKLREGKPWLVFLLVLVPAPAAQAQMPSQRAFPELNGPYLGQQAPPGAALVAWEAEIASGPQGSR